MVVAYYKMTPRVAVLLAAYNGTSYLSEQLDSILAQELVWPVIYVSIDPSSDGTERYIKERAENDDRIFVLPIGQRFGGAAKNFFRLICDVDVGDFDYVCFADQDDIWLPNKLSRAHDILSLNEASCYSSNVLAFWSSGRRVLIDKAQPQRPWDFLFEAAGPGCTYVMKPDFLNAIRPVLIARKSEVQNVALHDWFVYAFARANGYRWLIDECPGMLYRQHERNQVGVNTGWKAYWARAEMILCGWGISQARLIARLIGLENDPFCSPWQKPGRLGMIWLALNAYRARRKMSDRFVFAAACLFLAVIGDRSNE